MRQATTEAERRPVREVADQEVVAFREQFDGRSALDEIVRQGAQRMLQGAIGVEVEEFLRGHAARKGNDDNRFVVRNGYLPSREVLTGAGPLEVRQSRVRDNSPDRESRVRFRSAILPPYLRKSKALEEFIPWLYLRGVSTQDFSEALVVLFGRDKVSGLSPGVVVRLKEEWTKQYDEWCRRSLEDTQYVYVRGGWDSRECSPRRRGQSTAMLVGADGCHSRWSQGTDCGVRWIPGE